MADIIAGLFATGIVFVLLVGIVVGVLWLIITLLRW